MQKTLYLDAGNTRIKAAAIMHGKWQDAGSVHWRNPSLNSVISDICRPFERIVLSSVTKSLQIADLRRILAEDGITGVQVLDIARDSFSENRMGYRSPDTLGADRYLACLGAWNLTKSEHLSAVIVTDAGTACTIDVMDAGGSFRGGVIMPGLQTAIDSLVAGTDGLFRVLPELPATWPPDTTEAAIQAGTLGSFLAAWEAHVEKTLEIYPEAQIWVTGGEAEILMRYTDRPCSLHEFLVFEGMQAWLNENLVRLD